jgi:hypothetical protein
MEEEAAIKRRFELVSGELNERSRRKGGGRKLANELSLQGHQVSHQLVSELLHDLGYRGPRQPQDA